MNGDDRQLLKLLQQGKRSAMEEFYRRYSPLLYAVCRRYLSDSEDAKDVLQDSFVKMFSAVNGVSLDEGGTLKAWAVRIVVNNALNFIRSHRLMPTIMEEKLTEEIPDEEINADELSAEQIQSLIEELPVGYRTVFNLHAIERLSHKEIAQILGISESTSASQYHRAKKLLKQKILNLR